MIRGVRWVRRFVFLSKAIAYFWCARMNSNRDIFKAPQAHHPRCFRSFRVLPLLVCCGAQQWMPAALPYYATDSRWQVWFLSSFFAYLPSFFVLSLSTYLDPSIYANKMQTNCFLTYFLPYLSPLFAIYSKKLCVSYFVRHLWRSIITYITPSLSFGLHSRSNSRWLYWRREQYLPAHAPVMNLHSFERKLHSTRRQW